MKSNSPQLGSQRPAREPRAPCLAVHFGLCTLLSRLLRLRRCRTRDNSGGPRARARASGRASLAKASREAGQRGAAATAPSAPTPGGAREEEDTRRARRRHRTLPTSSSSQEGTGSRPVMEDVASPRGAHPVPELVAAMLRQGRGSGNHHHQRRLHPAIFGRTTKRPTPRARLPAAAHKVQGTAVAMRRRDVLPPGLRRRRSSSRQYGRGSTSSRDVAAISELVQDRSSRRIRSG